MAERDDELERWLAAEHAKNQEILKPLLEAQDPVPGVPSAAWDEWMDAHGKVVKAIAKLHEARERRRREA